MNRSIHMLQGNYPSVKETLCIFYKSLASLVPCSSKTNLLCIFHWILLFIWKKKTNKKHLKILTHKYIALLFVSAQNFTGFDVVELVTPPASPSLPSLAGTKSVLCLWQSRFCTAQHLEWDFYKKAFVWDVCLRFTALPSCLSGRKYLSQWASPSIQCKTSLQWSLLSFASHL